MRVIEFNGVGDGDSPALKIVVNEEDLNELKLYLFSIMTPLETNEYRGSYGGGTVWSPESSEYGCTRTDAADDCNEDGNYGDTRHDGVDLTGDVGDSCYAVGDGHVTRIREGENKMNGYGVIVAVTCEVENNNGQTENVVAFYAHLSETNVSVGDEVEKGDVIGEVGVSGSASRPDIHLHFEIINAGSYWPDGFDGREDPENYIEINDAQR